MQASWKEFQLPGNYAYHIYNPSYKIIRAVNENDPANNYILQFNIKNREPEREICFDAIVNIRDNANDNAPLLWGICTKQLTEKIIYSCSNSVQYMQLVITNSNKMIISVKERALFGLSHSSNKNLNFLMKKCSKLIWVAWKCSNN